jgi:hypothetical protein
VTAEPIEGYLDQPPGGPGRHHRGGRAGLAAAVPSHRRHPSLAARGGRERRTAMAVHGANVPWGRLAADGVIVAPARRVPDLLQALPAILGPERVAWLADRARLRFHVAA